MENDNFYAQVRQLLNSLYLATGYPLDQRLTGYLVSEAMHVNIDPAMEAIVRTEHRISPKIMVDLRELVNVAPPAPPDGPPSENLFITFTAQSAQFLGGNATAFGIHFTKANMPAAEQQDLDAGTFITGAQVTDVYRLIIFLRTPMGEVSLARTGVVIGLDKSGRLVAYQTFQFNPGLTVTRHAPSSLADADSQVMLYVFLTLSVFLMANQGEATVSWNDHQGVVIG
jgi:hypothetical protein